MPCSLDRFPKLAALLKGDDVRWPALGITPEDLLSLCEAEELTGLLYQRLSASARPDEWPEAVRDALSVRARAEASRELLRAGETRAVLGQLADNGVRAVLFKGTPLAYSAYDAPACRPRSDTDLLIRAEDVDAARRVMAARQYRTTVHCNELFSQFEVQKEDAFGVVHVFDVHWKISTQPVFADLLTYGELLERSQPVPALGPRAHAAGPTDALLLACVHPVMHHQNVERALWIYDIHLLASRLSEEDFNSFVTTALEKKVAAVSARGLRLSHNAFETRIPDFVFARLSRDVEPEPSAEYLDHDRRWHDELASSVRGLPAWGDRLRLVREVLFPSPDYMLGAYGLTQTRLATLLLPALYVHRNVHGAWKILLGKK